MIKIEQGIIVVRMHLKNSSKSCVASLVIVILLILQTNSLASSLNTAKVIQSITIENGGTNSVIYDINQDIFQRIWIASSEGVFVYNGKKAQKIWPQNKSQVAYSILKEKDQIYVSGGFGIVSFNSRTLEATPIEALSKHTIFDFIKQENTFTLALYDSGLYSFDIQTQKLKKIDISQFASSKDIKSIQIDKNNTIWAAVSAQDDPRQHLLGGLLQIKDNAVSAVYLQNEISNINNLTKYGNNFLISTSNNGILEFNPDSKKVIKQHYPKQSFPIINDIAIDNNNCLWLATMTQAQKVCNGHITNVSGDFLKSFPNTDIQSIYFDSENEIIWQGTISEGIKGIFTPKNDATSYAISSLSSASIFSVKQAANGDTWLAYNGQGIDIIKAGSENIEHIMPAERGSRGNHILSMSFSPSGEAYLGTFKGGVWKQKLGTKEFAPFIKSAIDRFKHLTVMDFAFEQKSIWIATIRELIKVNYDGKVLKTLSKTELINQGNIYGVMVLDSSNIVLATTNGLLKVNKVNLAQELLNPIDELAPGCDDGLMDFAMDKAGNVWYVSRALCKYNPQTNRVTSESTHPLFKAGMTAIIVLPDGRIAGHDGKIAIFDPKTKSVATFTQDNGHFIDESTQSFGAISVIDNKLNIALSKGLFKHDLEKSTPEPLPSSLLFISKLIVMNKVVPINEEQLSKSFTLTDEEKIASMDFEKVDFFNRKYSYKVDMPSILSAPLKLNQLTGFALPTAAKGTHNISLVASTNTNVEDRLNFNLKITPPFWQSPSAYVIYFLLAILFSYFFYLIRVFAIKRENTKLSLIVEQQTQELKTLLSDKERLFESISHELRTPLTILLGKSTLLLKNSKKEDIRIVNQQAQKLHSLVEKILKLVELKSIEKQYEQINLSSFFVNQIASIRSLSSDKDITIHLNDTSQLPQVKLVEETLELLLSNLLNNAIKYAPEHTTIEVFASIHNNLLDIEVVNQSTYFNTQKAKKRFIRFNDQITGTGIGLSIVEECTKLNNGKFTLALDNDLVTAKASLQVSIIEHCASLNFVDHVNNKKDALTILVVEDDPELNQFIHDIISSQFKTITCFDGIQALSYLNTADKLPDLILSDVIMPNMDGLTLSKMLKSNAEYSSIPFILLSGKTDVKSQINGFEALADDYILKPFNSELLLKKVTNMISTIRKAQLAAREILSGEENNAASKDETIIMKFLAKEFANEDASIHQLADQLSVSAKTLNRRLSKSYGMSFSQLLRDYRLEKAKILLLKGGTSKEACFKCGFSSQSYFSKCYKDKFKISPTKQCKNK